MYRKARLVNNPEVLDQLVGAISLQDRQGGVPECERVGWRRPSLGRYRLIGFRSGLYFKEIWC